MEFINLALLFGTNKQQFITYIEKYINNKSINHNFIKLCQYIYNYDLKHGNSGYLFCISNEMYQFYGKNIILLFLFIIYIVNKKSRQLHRYKKIFRSS